MGEEGRGVYRVTQLLLNEKIALRQLRNLYRPDLQTRPYQTVTQLTDCLRKTAAQSRNTLMINTWHHLPTQTETPPRSNVSIGYGYSISPDTVTLKKDKGTIIYGRIVLLKRCESS